MVRRLLILDLALVAVLVAMAVRFRSDWMNFEATHQPAAIQPTPEAVPKIASASTANAATPEEWTDIPAHNPFSFDRTDIPILEPVAPPKPPGTKPILFGTIGLGKELLAMVASGQPGNRNYKPMKVGEVIDGWTITKINDKSIEIKANEVEDSVLMDDATALVPRDNAGRTTAAPPPPSVVSTTPAAAAPQAPLFPTPPPQTTPPRTGRRRILQQTPFGVREIEVDE
jgi:hypothetical protein